MKLKSSFPIEMLRPSGLRARFLMAHLSVALLGVIITASYARYALDRAFAHHVQEDMMLQARLLADQVAQGGEPMARDERWTRLAGRWSKINGGHWTIYDSTCRIIGDSGSPSGERSLASQPTPSSALKGKVGVCLQRGKGVSGKRLLLAVPIWREELIVGVVRASVP
ncbi:MAG: hypothetical protein HY318_04590, partial [Armatimonadetes bacterium]|nr:hypothetical protein [Armatimonadota bacterium]